MKPPEDPHAFPSPGISVGLTFAALLLMLLVLAPLATTGRVVAGLAAGLVIGFGGVGSLAARRVPAPAELRMGLCGFPPRQILMVLALVPLALWLSEIENLTALWLGRPELPPQPEAGDTSQAGGLLSVRGLQSMEIALFVVLLRPVVEEFFFRGVIQQGAVARLGTWRGLLLSTLLFTLVRALTGPANEYTLVVLVLQSLIEGAALGGLRLATGSLLPGILLQGLINGVGLLAIFVAEDFRIQGFNTQDGHTHPALLAAAGLLIGWALLTMRRLHAEAPPLPLAPEPEES